jgi:hypothetical protein
MKLLSPYKMYQFSTKHPSHYIQSINAKLGISFNATVSILFPNWEVHVIVLPEMLWVWLGFRFYAQRLGCSATVCGGRAMMVEMLYWVVLLKSIGNEFWW